ncbi:MAG: DUF1599 domain-containing protein [Candidatus Pacebacteria bacterium]|nr:DUF1599 domain-containing protein [Candidatus Paceibacterota bacterium]MBP9780704.1 DUF1599 domain-containing protein [Candidatus Paceibacterota bacterium]
MGNKKFTTEEYFDEISQKILEIIESKKADYGLSILVYRPGAITTRIYTKILRVQSIQEVGGQKVDEPIEDTLQESLGYILFRIERCFEKKPKSIEVEKLKSYISKVRDTMIRKNHDYGEAWREMRISDITDEILSKLVRIRKMEDDIKKDSSKTEDLSPKIIDAIIDTYNYVVFALVHFKEKVNPML